MTRFPHLRRAENPTRTDAVGKTTRLQRTSFKISKLKQPSAISGTARSIIQGGLSKPPHEQKKSVRFRVSETSKDQQEENTKTGDMEAKMKLNSQVGDDFVFEEDADALASILNNDGISRDLLRKSQMAQDKMEGKSADEFLLVDGRPSLCRRVPIGRSSNVLPDGSRASSISSRVSAGPGRVFKPSLTGRPSFNVRRGNGIHSGARDSLFSFIEQRYSQRHQNDLVGRPSLQHGRTSLVRPALQQPPRLDASKKKERDVEMSLPRRVLSVRRQTVNPSTPLRCSAHPRDAVLCSPALRVPKSVKKTPGKCHLLDEKSPKFGGNIVTALDFQDEENQCPNVNLAPPRKLENTKLVKPISRPTMIPKRQSFIKKPSKYRQPQPASQKSLLPPRNSDRYHLVGRSVVSKPNRRDIIKTVSVETKLGVGEELVQPKFINDPALAGHIKPCQSAISELPLNGKSAAPRPKPAENVPQQGAIRKSKLQKSTIVAHKPPLKELAPLKCCNVRTLNDPVQVTMDGKNISMPAKKSTYKNSKTVANKKSELSTFGLRPKRNLVNVEEVLDVMQKKLAAIKRRSVQAEFSSVLRTVQMSLTSVAETVDDHEASELKLKENTPCDERSLIMRENLMQKIDAHQQATLGNEVLSEQSSPAWKDILENCRDHSDGAELPKQHSSNAQTSEVFSVQFSPTWKDILGTKSDCADESVSPKQQSYDALATKTGETETRVNEEIAEVAAEKMRIEQELERLKLEKEKLHDDGSGTENISRSKTNHLIAKPKASNSDLFATRKRIEKIINSKVPPPTPRPVFAKPKYFASFLSPEDANEFSTNATLPETVEHGGVFAVPSGSAGTRDASSKPSIRKTVYWTEKTPKPQSKFQSVHGNPRTLTGKAEVFPLEGFNNSKDVVESGTQNTAQRAGKIPLPPNQKDYAQRNISNVIPKRVVERKVSKSVHWSDTSSGNSPAFPPKDSPNVIKPKSADLMVWGNAGKVSKISSGRIGQKCTSSGKKESPVSSERCPITLVISPKLDAVKVGNSPVLREKLATSPNFAEKSFTASTKLLGSSEPVAPRHEHNSSVWDDVKDFSGCSPKFVSCLAKNSAALPKLNQKIETDVQTSRILPACASLSKVLDSRLSNLILSDRSVLERLQSLECYDELYSYISPNLEEDGSALLKYAENCSSNSLFQDSVSESQNFLEKFSQPQKFVEKCSGTLLQNSTISKITRDLPSPQSLRIVELETRKKSIPEKHTDAPVNDDVFLPSGDAFFKNRFELGHRDEFLPKSDITCGSLDKNENFVSPLEEAESNKENIFVSRFQENKEMKLASLSKDCEDTRDAASEQDHKNLNGTISPKAKRTEVKQTNNSNTVFEDFGKQSESSRTLSPNLLDASFGNTAPSQLVAQQSRPLYFSDVPLAPAPSSDHSNVNVVMGSDYFSPGFGENKTASVHTRVTASQSTATSSIVVDGQKHKKEDSNSGTATAPDFFASGTTNQSQCLGGTSYFNRALNLVPAVTVSRPLPILAHKSCEPTCPVTSCEPDTAAMRDVMDFSTTVEPRLVVDYEEKQKFNFSKKGIHPPTVLAAPKAVKLPPPQTPAAFRMIRQRLRESPTPKKIHPRSPFSMQSPSRRIRKTPQKNPRALISSPSVRLVGSKRFKEALLDEEVAILTCVRFRTSSAIPDDRTLKRSAMNPLGRVLLEGDDTHFVPISPIPAAKKHGGKDAISGSAFSAFRQ